MEEGGLTSGSSSTIISTSQPSDTDILQQQQNINNSFHELNFFPLPSQSNIYGLTHITIDGHNKLLVATVSGEIFRLEVDRQTLQSLWKPITFSYIPAEAEIISLDAFVREPHGVVVGVTLIKVTEPKDVYLNVYGLNLDPNSPLNWELVAEDWTPVNLQFSPFKLFHTEVFNGEKWELILLIPGNDLKVHVYKETMTSDKVLFEEEILSTEKWFPEFYDLNSSITDIVMQKREKGEGEKGCYRITAFGCQSGYIRCCLVDMINNVVLKSVDSTMMDGPITSVNVFPTMQLEEVHLLVTSALPNALILPDVFVTDFNQSVSLPHSDKYDAITCSVLGDVTCNGKDELMIGTYGKMFLLYQSNKRNEDLGEEVTLCDQ